RNQLNHVLYNIKRLAEEKAQEDENLQTVQTLVNDLKLAVDELRVQQGSARAELNELTSINNRLQNQIYKTEKDLEILQIQEQALEQESQRNIEDATNKEAELSHFNQGVGELQDRADVMEKDLQSLVEFENDLQEQIKDNTAELDKTKETIVTESRKLDAKQNEYNLTKSLVDNLEGFPESIRFLKNNAGWVKNVPLFSDILFCREEYRIAIENYLEPLMNYYVVESYDDAIRAINLLSNSSKGRAQFFVLSNYTAASAKSTLEVNPNWVPALNVVEVEKRYQPLCNHLLKNVYLINDDLGHELNNSSIDEGLVLIGKRGKFNKTKYTIAGGSVGLFEGKRIGRAKNLENLSKEIKQVDDLLVERKARLDELQSKLVLLKSTGKSAEIKQKQDELNRLNTELVTVKARQEQYQTFIETSLNRKDDIAAKINSIDEEILRLQPLLVELKSRKQIQNDLLADKRSAFTELNETVTVQSNTYNQENIRFHQQQNKVSGLAKDLDYRYTQQENLETRMKQNSEELEKVKIEIQENVQLADSSDDSLLEMD